MRSFSVISRSSAQTRDWGRKLGSLLIGGETIGLTGDLGSGKTCFVRGLAEGVEVDKRAWVRSPSFTLVNEYDGRLPLFHIDLYRISSAREVEELNLREYLFSDEVSVIEWFDRLPEGEVEEYLHIAFNHENKNRRRLTFTGHGHLYEGVVERLGRKG
ncbi:MAG: tRNA (adenosine(37)-N6)-threonylcarbamoyltransferase complex ATPase subunit type 1 TsaE [Candidatus Binatia bacterium]